VDLSPLVEAIGPGRHERAHATLAAAVGVAERAHAAHAAAAADLEALVPCGCLTAALGSWLSAERAPIAPLGDAEGPRLDPGLPPVCDAHVHVFPDRMFAALWSWFERYGWPVRYPLRAPEVVSFLLERGVSRAVLLHYAHKPGLARSMNAFVAELAGADERLVGLATVLPGEPDARGILEEAKAMGLRGVKLHCHVQAFAADEDAAAEVFEAAQALELPVVVHAGREPRSPAYPVDTHAICAAERTERVLSRYPNLRLCVPHFGGDEFDAYEHLLERFDNLYLDTTMILGGLFGVEIPERLLTMRPDRILYGTDFPNLPYAWDREIKTLSSRGLDDAVLAQILSGTAAELFAK